MTDTRDKIIKYTSELETRKDVIKMHVINSDMLYFVPDGTGKYKFCSKNPDLQKWCENVKNKRVKKDVLGKVVAAAKTIMGNQQSNNQSFTKSSTQSLGDKAKKVDWSQENMVIHNFSVLVGILGEKDLKQKMPTKEVGHFLDGTSKIEATYIYNNTEYKKIAHNAKDARRGLIYDLLHKEFGIGQKKELEEKQTIVYRTISDVEGFKRYTRENLRDEDCRLWFRSAAEDYGIKYSWRPDSQKRVRRSDGGWAQENSSVLSIEQDGKKYSFEGSGRSLKDAENNAILKMAKEFCGLDMEAEKQKEKEHFISGLQQEFSAELKYLKVLSEREDMQFGGNSYRNYFVDTPYGEKALFEEDMYSKKDSIYMHLLNHLDVTPDMLNSIKISKEEEAKIHQSINQRIDKIIEDEKNKLQQKQMEEERRRQELQSAKQSKKTKDKQKSDESQKELNKNYTVKNKQTDGEDSFYTLVDENGSQFKLKVEFGNEKSKQHHTDWKDQYDYQDGKTSRVEDIKEAAKTIKISVEKAEGEKDDGFSVYSAVEPEVFEAHPDSLMKQLMSNAKKSVGSAKTNQLTAMLRSINKYNQGHQQEQSRFAQSLTRIKVLTR